MGGFSGVGPTSGQVTATFGGRQQAAAPSALVPGVLDYAISGDSIVKYAERMGTLAHLTVTKTGGAALHAVDFPAVRAGYVWLVQNLFRVSPGAHSSSAFLLQQGKPEFLELSPILVAADMPGIVSRGHVVAVGASAGGGIEQTLGSANIFVSKPRLFTLPEGWFIRYAANIGSAMVFHLKVYGAELLRSDLEACL